MATLEGRRRDFTQCCLDAVRRGNVSDLQSLLTMDGQEGGALYCPVDPGTLWKRLICIAAAAGHDGMVRYLCTLHDQHFDTIVQMALRHTFHYAIVSARQRGHSAVVHTLQSRRDSRR